MDLIRSEETTRTTQTMAHTTLTVLVTGATGSLGKQLLYELTRQGYRPIAQVRDSSQTAYADQLNLEKRVADLRVAEDLTDLVQGVEVVIHSAAWVNFRKDRLTQFAGINTMGAINLYKAARAAGVKRFIHVSTIAAVGARVRSGNGHSPHPAVVAEDFSFNLAHLHIPYIMTKRAAEEELVKLAAEGGPELVIVNPSIIVGPSRTGDDRARAKQRFGSLILPGMHNVVNVVDIRDVAPAIVRAITQGRAGERYILAGDNVSARELILTVTTILKITPHVWSIPRWLINVAGWGAGVYHQVRTALGGRHKISFYPDIVKLLDYDWAYSSRKAREELGFRPRSVHATLKDLLNNQFNGTYMRP